VEPLDIALHAGHPLASSAGITPDELRDERWISTHAGFPLAGVLEHLGALSGRAPRIVHRVNEFSVAAQIVRTGDAVAVMPRTTAAPLAVDGMVLRPVVGATLVRHVDVLARPDALAQAPVRAVLAALRRVADAAADAAERTDGA
jgi:DNA-binding transcriptional LysR family regulator